MREPGHRRNRVFVPIGLSLCGLISCQNSTEESTKLSDHAQTESADSTVQESLKDTHSAYEACQDIQRALTTGANVAKDSSLDLHECEDRNIQVRDSAPGAWRQLSSCLKTAVEDAEQTSICVDQWIEAAIIEAPDVEKLFEENFHEPSQ